MKTRILLYVDDDPNVPRLLVRRLQLEFHVDSFSDPPSVEAAARATRYDGFIADLEMPNEVDGYEMIRRVEAIDARLARRAVLLSGNRLTMQEQFDLASGGGCLVVHKDSSLQESFT